MTLPPDAVPETPAETIERLLKSNNRLAQMVKASSDRMQSATRSILATGWDAGALSREHDDLSEWEKELLLANNPYRQTINIPGDTQ